MMKEMTGAEIIADLEKSGSCFVSGEDGIIVHIDKLLPYICIYRIPASGPDYFSGILDRTESSYIIAPAAASEKLKEILTELSGFLATRFGAYLILESWTLATIDRSQPEIVIYGPEDNMPATINKLHEELDAIDLPGKTVNVTVNQKDLVAPPGMVPLMDIAELKKNEGLLVGIEFQPFYINPDIDQPYPAYTRFVRTHLGKALKKALFEFVRVQTSYNATHFEMLGSSRITENMKDADDQLADISSKFRFLFLVSPINTNEAWEKFRESNFKSKPVFHYRLLPIDPELAKRQLYNIEIEKIEDPTMAFIFRDKRSELDKMLSMLAQRDTPDFLNSSLQLFGGVSKELYAVAVAILTIISPEKETEHKVRHISAEEFADRAREEFRFFQRTYPDIDLKAEVSNSVDSLMVSNNTLHISSTYKIPENRVEALIQHEVGTHLLTYINGKAQPLKQLSQGVPGYEELQEGLAVLAEYLSDGFTNDRMRMLAARVVAVKSMADGASFADTFSLLHEEYGFGAQSAFGITTRIYRGGGLTKDAVYLRGLISLLEHINKGQKIESLLVGKIREDYISIIEELIYRKVLNPAPLLPRYLVEGEGRKRLDEIKNGFDVFNLIQNRKL